MLSSAGVTKKQKRNAVLFEAFSLGMISIPLGIFAGIIGMWITFSCINPIFMNAFSTEIALQMKISYSAIFIAILSSVATILISAYIPARRASRISAIDAIRQTNDIKLKDKQLRISRITRYLFGIEGILAIKNLKRNRKRYRALVFSMFIGLVLFNSVGSYVYYLSGAVGITLEGDNFDLEVGDIRSEKSIEMFANIRELELVSEATYIEMPKGYYYRPSDTAKSYLTKEYVDLIMKSVSGIEDIGIDEALEYSPITIEYRFLDDDSFREYVSKFGGNAEEYFNTESVRAVLVNKVRRQEGYSINEFVPFTLQEGDVVDAMEGYYVEEREEFEKREFMNTPIIINDVTSEIPDYIGINYDSLD